MLPRLGSSETDDDGDDHDGTSMICENNTTRTIKIGNGNGAAKFVYITRSPLDTCVSFYHHLSHQAEGRYEKSLENFFRQWMDGELPFGSWADHILSYAPLVARGEVFLLRYEDMIHDLRGCVRELVEFLGLDEKLSEKDWEIALSSFSFEHMKNDLKRFQPKSVTWTNDFQFLRKGEVGDSKNTFENEDRTIFQEHLEKKKFWISLEEIFGDNKAGFQKYIKNLK